MDIIVQYFFDRAALIEIENRGKITPIFAKFLPYFNEQVVI